jgi:single-strand DNA-binding protein
MPNYNHVVIMGNATRDPELRYTPKGTAVCELGLAINRSYTGDDGQKKQDTTFVDVTFWARVAEIVQQYVKKGNPLFVQGRLQLETWQDKQTNQPRSKLKVVGENIQLLTGRPEQSAPFAPTPSARNASASAPSRPTPPRDPDLDAEPDDIPF